MATLVNSGHGTVRRACTLDYYGGGITGATLPVRVSRARSLASKVDLVVGFFQHFGGTDAPLIGDMLDANGSLVAAPYVKGLEIAGGDGVTARGANRTLPENYFAHSKATRAPANRMHVFKKTGSIYLAQPSDGGTFVDSRGFTSHSWEEWRSLDGWTDIAAVNTLRGGEYFNALYLDSLSAGPSIFGFTAHIPGTSTEYGTSAWHNLAYSAVGDQCLADAPGGKFVFANGLTDGNRYFASTSGLLDHCDVGLAESWLRDNNSSAGDGGFKPLAQWKSDINMVLDVEDRGKGCWLTVNMINGTAGGGPFPTISAAQYEQWRRFAICSYMLAKGQHTYFEFVANAGTAGQVDPWNEDHPYYHLNLGDPVDYGTTVDDFEDGSGWKRTFADGTVFVNPTSAPVTFVADRDYFFYDGTAAYSSGATITLTKFSGLMLTSDSSITTTWPPPGGGGGGSGGGTGGGDGDGTGGTDGGGDYGTGDVTDIVYPDTLTGHAWVMKLTDIRGNTLCEIDEAYARELQYELNGIDSCSFSVPLDWVNADKIQPLSTSVKVWRQVIDPDNDVFYRDANDLPSYAGVVANVEMDAAANEMKVQTYNCFWKLQSRFHIDRHNYKDWKPANIIWDLIHATNSLIDTYSTGGDFTGIVGPTTNFASLWSMYGSWPSYGGSPPLFNAHTPRGQNSWQFIQDFLQQNGTPDLVPLYIHREGSRAMQMFNVAIVRGVRPNAAEVSLGYRTGENNLEDLTMQVSVEPGQFATYTTCQGQGDTDDFKVTYPKAFDTDGVDRINALGVYIMWEKFDHVIRRTDLRNFAIDLYKRARDPLTTYTPTISPATPPYFRVHFDVGDVIQLSVDKGAFQLDAVDQRVYEVKVSMTEANFERVELTMAKDFTSSVPS